MTLTWKIDMFKTFRIFRLLFRMVFYSADGDMYIPPAIHTPPPVEALTNNTDFPHLNSIEYRLKKPLTLQVYPQPFWDILEVDTLGQIVLVTNDYASRTWNGSFFGYESFEHVGNPEKAIYSKQYDDLITNFKFAGPNIAIVSDSTGAVNLWSTKAKTPNDYWFTIIRKSEHIGRIGTLELFHNDATKALTGSSDCCIKVWDMSGWDLRSNYTYKYAHSDAITGVSASHSMSTVFSSCSRDKKWAIWDYRQRKPITALSKQHDFAYTAIYWSDVNENNEHVLVGDDTGSVWMFDIRNLSTHVDAIHVFDAPVYKFCFEGKVMTVLGQTNVLKVYDTFKGNKMIFKNSDATTNVRDIYWCDANTFYTIAWDSKIRKYQLESDDSSQENVEL